MEETEGGVNPLTEIKKMYDDLSEHEFYCPESRDLKKEKKYNDLGEPIELDVRTKISRSANLDLDEATFMSSMELISEKQLFHYNNVLKSPESLIKRASIYLKRRILRELDQILNDSEISKNLEL